MAHELEVKAVVPDAPALLARLLARLRAAGAVERFAGAMEDRRYDREGEVTASPDTAGRPG